MFNIIKRKWHTEWFEKIIIPFIPVMNESVITKHYTHDWEIICQNENFLPEFVLIYPQYKNVWDWTALSSNPNLSISFILKNKDVIPFDKWNWQSISKNKNMTPSIIESNLNLPWVWDMIIYNPSIYQDDAFLEKYMSLFSKFDARNTRKLKPHTHSHGFYTIINYACLTFIKRNLTVLSYFYINFWVSLSHNPNLTPEFIKEHINEKWSFDILSRNKCITPELVNDTIMMDWDWHSLSSNPSIPISFVEEHMDRDWNWDTIAYEKATPSFYLNHSEKCSLQHLSANPNMIDLIINHPDWNWDWNLVSTNKALPYWFVKDNNKNWNYLSSHLIDIMCDSVLNNRKDYKNIPKFVVLKNNMVLSREQYISTKIENFIKESKDNILQQLMEVTWHPDRLKWVLDEDQRELFV